MAHLREVNYEDLEAVATLSQAQGWNRPSLQGWQHLWRDNPALEGRKVSRGWVLEAGGSVVGFVANVAQLYRHGDRILFAAAASGLLVAPAFRGSSLQLMVAFTTQPGVDLLLNTTAAPHVSKIMEFLKLTRIPQPDYDRSLYWVLRPVQFAAAGLRKKGFSAISRPASVGLGPLLWMEGRLRGRGSASRSRDLELRTLDAVTIGAEFDSLWERRVAERTGLLAVRDARTLRWHFAARSPTPPLLIGAYRGTMLKGYLAVVRRDSPHLGLARALVADIFVERDDPLIVRALVSHAMVEARRGGAAMLEIVGFPARIREALWAYRPFELVNESWPFLYRASDPVLHRELGAERAWFASSFDGDGSL